MQRFGERWRENRRFARFEGKTESHTTSHTVFRFEASRNFIVHPHRQGASFYALACGKEQDRTRTIPSSVARKITHKHFITVFFYPDQETQDESMPDSNWRVVEGLVEHHPRYFHFQNTTTLVKTNRSFLIFPNDQGPRTSMLLLSDHKGTTCQQYSHRIL